MKTKINSFLISTLACAWLFASANAANHADKEETPAEASREILYVEYRENHNDFHVRGFDSMDNELDRFHYFKSNFKDAFEKQDWSVDIEVSRFPINAPEGAKVLRITYLGLKSSNSIEIELRLWANLKAGEKESDFGVVQVRHVPSPILSLSSIDRDLDKIYTEAAAKVVEELNKTLFARK
ncbi:MAG: hypothetical protein O3C43_17260 [Verrucomicrobia bacterium]|nr:hypothetical protein [Verrucomicrobiota bacterium]MDA1068240.1 hypothetical protein [Verrucomicrobiota bacterium]